MIPVIANSLWLGACLPEYLRFRRAVTRVEDTQAALLQGIVSANADTEFGRMHGFKSIRSVRDFQSRVPLRNYDAHEPWITRIAGGETNLLTRQRVRLFEPSSGSTGASKLVPYTSSLQQQFRRGIQAWTADLFLHHPELLTGAAYWSVSPMATEARYSSGGIPIGFDEDAAYLGGWQQRLVNSVMAVPGALSKIHDLDTVRYLTLLFLVSCRNLKLISVWNPAFLSLLMERLPEWGDEIARDLERGIVSRTGLELALPRNPRRALDLKAALRSNTLAERNARLWPELKVISCWTDANASAPSAILQGQFPQSRIQGKGLLATECFVSFPLVGREGGALAVRSHFFEFLPVGLSGETESPLLAHELVQGQQYAVLVTTGGGLYRYQLGDLIEVTGRLHDCPLIRFLGRQDQVSDWFGEKLNEAHVAGILRKAFDDHKIAPAFAMLACDISSAPAYVLYIETEAPDLLLNHIAANIEDALCNNFHYRYARQLGQLAPLKTFRVRNAAATFLENAIASGQRAGNVKPAALDTRGIWCRRFQGQFVTQKDWRNQKTAITQ
ncbi:MAG TPA: GH3 auxin-responsive promoter family protein [Candidatus Angelobacter sp.]